MWCTIHQAFLAERMLEMNPAEANEGQGLPGLAGELPGRKGGGPNAQDQIAKLLRARLRGLFGGAQEERQEAGHRSCQTGARTPGRVRGIDGQTAALEGAGLGRRMS
jgi:hypothetical protein